MSRLEDNFWVVVFSAALGSIVLNEVKERSNERSEQTAQEELSGLRKRIS
jgi:hypothetical protein